MNTAGLCLNTWWQPGALAMQLEAGGQREETALVQGDSIALAVMGPRMCVGYRPPQQPEQIPCPDQTIASGSGPQCLGCGAREAILPCMRCAGDRCYNPKRRQDCIQPKNHAVYIAAYAPQVLKVGVARWERRLERVIEQGARAAYVVGQADGLAARRLEWQISEVYRQREREALRRGDEDGVRRAKKLTDRLLPRTRLSAWAKNYDIAQLQGEIQQELQMLQTRVITPWWLPEPLELELPVIPTFYPVPTLIDSAEGLMLRGTIESIAGQIMIVRSDTGQLLALSGRALPGYFLRPLADNDQGEPDEPRSRFVKLRCRQEGCARSHHANYRETHKEKRGAGSSSGEQLPSSE